MKALTKKVSRTFSMGLRAHQVGRRQHKVVMNLLTRAIAAMGVAVQRILARLQQCVEIAEEEGQINYVDLYLPISAEQAETVRGLMEMTPTKQAKRQKLLEKRRKKGAKEMARPLYNNSYHMVEVVERNQQRCVRCLVAEAFRWKAEAGKFKGQWQRAVEKIDAKIGLQGLIKSWLPIDWSDVPSALRAGACQKAAQDFNSHIGLRAKELKASFPSLRERDPARRHSEWRQSLRALVLGTHGLEKAKAREVYPEKFAEDDTRGERLVVTNPHWLNFIRSPFPDRQSLLFVKSGDVVLYRHEWLPGLFAALPLLQGVSPTSPIGRLVGQEVRHLQWWKKYAAGFTPLSPWGERRLTVRQSVVVVQVQSRNQERLNDMLSGEDGRKVDWSLSTERRGTHERRKNRPQWALQLATSRWVTIPLRPNILGIHFGTDPVLWWTLMDTTQHVLRKGNLQPNEILTEGLSQQLRLMDEQNKQRWIGGRKFAKELGRRTDEVARAIVELAAAHDANLALEDIKWVDKQHGSPDANRRYSLWNFSQLAARIEWMGQERRVAKEDNPVATVCHVTDYVLRYTCPQCGACRQAKQPQDKATTWRQGDLLLCRSCGYVGPVSDEHQANLVSTSGVEAYLRLLAKPEKDQEQPEEANV